MRRLGVFSRELVVCSSDNVRVELEGLLLSNKRILEELG